MEKQKGMNLVYENQESTTVNEQTENIVIAIGQLEIEIRGVKHTLSEFSSYINFVVNRDGTMHETFTIWEK